MNLKTKMLLTTLLVYALMGLAAAGGCGGCGGLGGWGGGVKIF